MEATHRERCQLHADLVEATATGDADGVARLAAAHSVKPNRDTDR